MFRQFFFDVLLLCQVQRGGRKKTKNIQKVDNLRKVRRSSGMIQKKRKSSGICSLVVSDNTKPSSLENVKTKVRRLSRKFRRLSLKINQNDIVKASFSQSSTNHMSAQTVGTQCTSMSLVSIIHASLKPPSEWLSSDLNNILLQGDNVHGIAIERRLEHLQQSGQLDSVQEYRYLDVGDLIEINPIEYNGEYYEIEDQSVEILQAYLEPSVAGLYQKFATKEEFEFAFTHIFPEHSNCILTIGVYSYAIHREKFQGRDIYFFFDSHPRDDKSSLFRFDDLSKLIEFVQKQCNPTSRFEVSPLKLKKVDRVSLLSSRYRNAVAMNKDKKLHEKNKRKLETFETTECRLEKQRKYRQEQIANESIEEADERRKNQCEYSKKQIANETIAETQKRLEKKRENRKGKIENESKEDRYVRNRTDSDRKFKKVNQMYLEMSQKNQKDVKCQKNKDEKIEEYIEEFIEYRQRYINILEERGSKSDELVLNYFTNRSVGPTCVCFCCQGLFFLRQVWVKNLDKIVETAERFV